MSKLITPRKKDYSRWYTDLITQETLWKYAFRHAWSTWSELP